METRSDQEYFEAIYHDTFNKLSQYVLFKTRGIGEAEDVVAAVYADFYQYIVLKHKRPENVPAYLTKMANHELSRLYTRKTNHLSIDDEELRLHETIPDDVDVELAVFDQFETDELWQAVGKLAPVEQQILAAKFRFDLTFKEIAQILGQGESAIKLRYYRSLKKLQKLLNEDVTFSGSATSYYTKAFSGIEGVMENE